MSEVPVSERPVSEKPVSETSASTRGRPFAMKNLSIAGRASSPVAKAGITVSPRASIAAITPS